MTNWNTIATKMNEWFQTLHAQPEISWEEVKTTDYLVEQLEAIGLRPQRFEGMTGLYVDIGKGTPRVGLRTDIDALWQEVDGVCQANHSCGHDGHMTMALGAAYYFAQQPNINGAVRIIFQPAEEKGTGAKAVIKQGVIEPLHYLFGTHVRPLKELQDGHHAPAIYHGAAKMFSGEIIGKQAHGARPEMGVNAIEVGAHFIMAMKTLWTNPNISSSVKVTQFEAGGEATNIIPSDAKFKIDARAAQNDVMDQLTDQLHRVATQLSTLHGATIRLKEDVHIAAALVDREAEAMMKRAIEEVVGQQYVADSIVTPGGEDFHFYTLAYPNLKATMLGLGCGVTPGLHDPHMTFNQERLLTGAQILTTVVQFALQQEGEIDDYV